MIFHLFSCVKTTLVIAKIVYAPPTPFEEGRAYYFAHVSMSVCWSLTCAFYI